MMSVCEYRNSNSVEVDKVATTRPPLGPAFTNRGPVSPRRGRLEHDFARRIAGDFTGKFAELSCDIHAPGIVGVEEGRDEFISRNDTGASVATLPFRLEGSNGKFAP
jgi:hypothetical protein